MKYLYRSTTNKKCAGLLGGIAEYANIDPSVIRLVYVFITCITGVVPGIIAYALGVFIVPKQQ